MCQSSSTQRTLFEAQRAPRLECKRWHWDRWMSAVLPCQFPTLRAFQTSESILEPPDELESLQISRLLLQLSWRGKTNSQVHQKVKDVLGASFCPHKRKSRTIKSLNLSRIVCGSTHDNLRTCASKRTIWDSVINGYHCVLLPTKVVRFVFRTVLTTT